MFLRWFAVLLLCLAPCLWSQQQRRPPPPPPEPEEEDISAEPEYTFNPIQARKEVQVGDFYFKKGSYKAAAGRYERATKWQPGLTEAYLKLGEARARLHQPEAARAAWEKYLELEPSGGRAAAVKKKIAQLPKKAAKPDEPAGPRPPTPGPRSF